MKSLTLLPAPLLALVTTIAAQSPPATTTLPSGLEIEDTTPASCSRPSRPGDNIAVNYRGTLLSTGALFDESYKRGKPFTFKLGAGQVIKGWDEGLQRMCPGEGRKLTIPADLAYGDMAIGSIPAGSTLVFETVLEDIVGVEQLPGGPDRGMFASVLAAHATPRPSKTSGGVNFASTIELMASHTPATTTTAQATSIEPTGDAFSIATASPEPPKEEEFEHADTDEHGPAETPPNKPPSPPSKPAECHLLGPFALLVQGALGVMAILSLVYKRWRETPKRPWKIFFFDVSKQVSGSMLTHILNLAMSMLGSVDMVHAAANAGTQSAPKYGRMPNPCSFYLLNLAIDTTIGIPILYILLKVLHALFLHTPLANPPESIKSGNYSQPPKATWWAKQLLIYFIGLTGMKLCVLFFFAAMPWLPWIGDWALRWTEGNEALQVTFAMFIFPLAMNAIQYWVIDNFIMDKKKGGKGEGYEAVADDDEEEHSHDQDSVTEVGSENPDVRGKQQVESGMLAEVNPTPVDAEGSGRQTPVK